MIRIAQNPYLRLGLRLRLHLHLVWIMKTLIKGTDCLIDTNNTVPSLKYSCSNFITSQVSIDAMLNKL